MPRSLRGRSRTLRALVVGTVALVAARPAAGAEITALISGADPAESWKTGYGAALTITLFNLVGGEIEGIWQGGERPETGLLTLSGKAYVGPSLGRVVPYVGLGAGVYRQSLPGDSDTGTLGSVFVGVKLRFPFGLVVRGEFQWVDLPLATPVDLDHRYFLGVGLAF